MRGHRSGIANLVGAVFFILIVVLMVGALGTMFGTFNSFVEGQNTSNQATLQVQQQSLNVRNLTFGGITSYNGFKYAATGTVTLSPNTAQSPILPIPNMNFTGGMQGWTTSQSYTLVSDNATVQASPQLLTYNGTYFPSQPETFSLVVTNRDPLASPYQIARVSLLVDQNWGVPTVQPLTTSWGATPLVSTPPSVVGNNITWVSSLPYDIGSFGGSQTFLWSANVPHAYGTFYQTVVVSWLKNNVHPFLDTAIATVNTTVTDAEVSRTGTSGTSTALINSARTGTSSSGLTAGYDANALQTSSESGPGSLYVDYQPSFNSAPISDGQQLTGTVDFTTSFSLDSATASGLSLTKCCTLSWASSLDDVDATRNSLVMYQAYLTNPNGVALALPVGGTSCGATPSSQDYMNPTALNDFQPTGWVFSHVCFNPGASIPAWLKSATSWYPGIYTLTIVVKISVPGASALSAGYPPQVSIHLDDIGLALKPVTTTSYGSATFQIPTGLNKNQVQGLELGVNATGASQNTTIYAYLADNSRTIYNAPLWVQVGSASFLNAGTIDSVSPLPNAAYYVNTTAHVLSGQPETGDLIVKVNAISSVPLVAPAKSYTVKLSIYAVIQTINQTRAVVELTNVGNAPVKLLSLVITGHGTAVSSGFPANFYFSPGQKTDLPVNLRWTPGQVYTVTVTTTSGLIFSSSFTAPLA